VFEQRKASLDLVCQRVVIAERCRLLMVKVVTVIAFLLASVSVQAAPVTITDALNQQQGQVSGTIQQGEVSVTISDCGEIQQDGGFPRWAYLLLATPAICFTGICTNTHYVSTPGTPPSVPNTTTTEANQPAPVPEPSSVLLFLIGLATLWRKRQGTD
jgi:hypothetical protein